MYDEKVYYRERIKFCQIKTDIRIEKSHRQNVFLLLVYNIRSGQIILSFGEVLNMENKRIKDTEFKKIYSHKDGGNTCYI